MSGHVFMYKEREEFFGKKKKKDHKKDHKKDQKEEIESVR